MCVSAKSRRLEYFARYHNFTRAVVQVSKNYHIYSLAKSIDARNSSNARSLSLRPLCFAQWNYLHADRGDINFTGIFHVSARLGSAIHHRGARLKLGLIKRDYTRPPVLSRESRAHAIRGRRESRGLGVVGLYYLARFTFRGVVACVVEK